MIYGSVNLSENLFHSNFLLQNVENVLKWNNCIPDYFSRDAFTCAYLSEKKILSREDVFYRNDQLGLTVLIDGFIYNLEELSSKIPDGNKVSNSPEYIAKAYLKWGETFVQQLNGDFAICIYDSKKNQALFFVDHLGIRPLAISAAGSTAYFATDAMGLSKALFKHQKIDKDYLLNMFLRAGHDYMLAPNKSIIRVKPGHYFIFSKEHRKMVRYWFPEKIKTDNTLTKKQVISDLNQLLADSVMIRADQRFSASAHVSGGLDSSIVAALARKAYPEQKRFYGFSWSPKPEETEERGFSDERYRVNQICRQNNMEPVFSNIHLEDYLTFVSGWRHPSELVFENKIVSAAKAKDIDLIFSGWGGDEFISIANRGIDADLLKVFDWKHFLKKYPVWKLKKFASAIRLEVLFLLAQRNYSRQKAEAAVFPYISSALKSNRIPTGKRFHYHSRRDVHLQLINLNHIAARTADWYVNGQLNGIEYRYPLLDVRIVEYMLKVPSKHLVNGYNDRIIFRELGKGLFTDDILSRLAKSDPAKSNAFSTVSSYGKEQFMSEFNAFRNNPDLNFVDFELLQRDLNRMSVTPQKDKPIVADIFFYLKKAHEFTKGYYS